MSDISLVSSTISDKRRELMFKVLGDEFANTRLLYAMYLFNSLTRCDDLLRWLIARGFIGKRLIEFMEDSSLTPLALARFAFRLMDRENNERQIIYGKDFIG